MPSLNSPIEIASKKEPADAHPLLPPMEHASQEETREPSDEQGVDPPQPVKGTQGSVELP